MGWVGIGRRVGQADSALEPFAVEYSCPPWGIHTPMLCVYSIILSSALIKDSAFLDQGLIEHLNGLGWLLQGARPWHKDISSPYNSRGTCWTHVSNLHRTRMMSFTYFSSLGDHNRCVYSKTTLSLSFNSLWDTWKDQCFQEDIEILHRWDVESVLRNVERRIVGRQFYHCQVWPHVYKVLNTRCHLLLKASGPRW